MNATLQFKTHEQAKQFATAYSRRTLRGHTISAAINPVQTVDVYDLAEDDVAWIDEYISRLNL